MFLPSADSKILWEQYLKTKSNECREALVQHYIPAVQRQTILLACGLEGTLAHNGQRHSDELAQGEEGIGFVPFVPPVSAPRPAKPSRVDHLASRRPLALFGWRYGSP